MIDTTCRVCGDELDEDTDNYLTRLCKLCRCPECGAPTEPPKWKFNGGNPVQIRYPTCDCDEREMDDYVDRLIESRKEQGKN